MQSLNISPRSVCNLLSYIYVYLDLCFVLIYSLQIATDYTSVNRYIDRMIRAFSWHIIRVSALFRFRVGHTERWATPKGIHHINTQITSINNRIGIRNWRFSGKYKW